ncbi:hypothetical protein ACWEP4_40635 [Streptomyces sp. NPDC004227]
MIDPTITIAPSPSDSQDTMVLQEAPTTNFNTSWKPAVGKTAPGVARSLIRFPLDEIPARTKIDSARMAVTLSTPLYAFTARPVRGALVVGDVLVAAAVKPGDRHVYGNGRWGPSVGYDGRLVAYSLTDGTRAWTAELDNKAQGLAVDGTALWALTDDDLTRIDPRTGHRTSNLSIHGARPHDPVQLWARDGLFACVAADGTDDYSPVLVLV